MSSKLDVLSISVFMCLFIHAEPVAKSMYIKCKWGEISRFSEDRINLLSGSHNKHIQNLSRVTFKIWWNLLVEFSSTPWGVIMNRDMLFQCRLQFLSYSPICIARVSRFRKSHEESMHVYLLSFQSIGLVTLKNEEIIETKFPRNQTAAWKFFKPHWLGNNIFSALCLRKCCEIECKTSRTHS